MKRTQRGVTLVELMVVVAIIAILAAVFISNSSIGGYGLTSKTLSEQLAAQLNAVRTRALQTRRIHQAQIRLDLATPEIDVYAAPNPGMALTNFTGAGVVVQGVQRIELPKNMIVQTAVAGATASGQNPSKTSAEVDITYYPDGTVKVGSTNGATIYITDQRSAEKYRVVIYHTTGSAYARQTW